MIKLITKNFDGTQNIKEILNEEIIYPKQSQQFYFDNIAGRKYTFNLVDGEKSIELIFLDKNGEQTKIKLVDMAELIKQSDDTLIENSKSVLGIIDDSEGMSELSETALNPDFQGDNVISQLKELLSNSDKGEDFQDGIIIDDFASLVEIIEVTAAGENSENVASSNLTSLDPLSQSYSVEGREIGSSYTDSIPDSQKDSYLVQDNISAPEIPTPTPESPDQTNDDEVEINEGTIRLDEAPEFGTIQIKIDGQWQDMEIGKEYGKDSEVKFVPDSDKIKEETEDIFVGIKDPSNPSLGDWGDVSGDTATFIKDGVTITTTLSGGQDIILHDSNRPSHGIGIGDALDKDGNGLSKDETLTVAIDGKNVNQITFHLAGLGHRFDSDSSHATKIVIKAYDKDGNLIEVQSGYRDPNSENIYESSYTFSLNNSTNSSEIAYFVLGTEGGDGTYVVQDMTLSKTVYDDVEFTTTQPDGTEDTVKTDINIPNSDADKEIIMDDEYIQPIENDSTQFSFENQINDETLDSVEITKLPEFGTLTLLDGTEVKVGDVYPKDTEFSYVNNGTESSTGDEIKFIAKDSNGNESEETSLIIKNDESGIKSIDLDDMLSDDIDLDLLAIPENNTNLVNTRFDSLNINLDDIVDLNDIDETKIFGEFANKVILEGGTSVWNHSGNETIDGDTFNVYNGSTPGTSNIKILIDEDVSISPDL